MDKIKKFLKILGHPKLSKQVINLMFQGALLEFGWVKSMTIKKSVDKEGNPIPWFTYPSIQFIDERLNKEMDMFEYGSGNSTLYFAKKVRSIVSVEHNKDWFEKINKKKIKNIRVIFQDLNQPGKYAKTSVNLNKKFDLIVIDGKDRVNCIKSSIKCLKEDGVIIFDNSNNEKYKEGFNILFNNNFKRIDFYGMAPISLNKVCTSIFYKNKNCFNI